MTDPATGSTKIKDAIGSGKSSFRVYRELYYGDTSLDHVLLGELLQTLLGPLPGAAGLFLRSKLYPCLLGSVTGKVYVGRNVTFRHPRKIRLGSNVVLDDNSVIDAKGEQNSGIDIGDGVFVGRNTIVYCKGGNIRLDAGVNIASNCTLFSSNELTVGAGTMIGAYSYLLSGGEYDYRKTEIPFAQQSGMETKGPLSVGRNCWLGARVTVLDAASIGDHCVVGAGAVVTKPLPSHSVAVGVPARVVGSTAAQTANEKEAT